MGERWTRFWEWVKKEYSWNWLRKEFSSWSVKGLFTVLFGFAVGGIAWVFANMSFGSFVLLVVCVIVAVVSAMAIVRLMVRELRRSVKPAMVQKSPEQSETARRRRIRKKFQKLIDEAKYGGKWPDDAFGNWVSRVEHAMRPLVPDAVEEFLQLFGEWKGLRIAAVSPFAKSAIQARQECVAWLESMMLKYWL